MDAPHRLAENVRRLRKEKGWSQEAFAEHAGIHRTYVSQLERAKKNVTITVLDRLAAALGVAPGAVEPAADRGLGVARPPRESSHSGA